MRGGRVHRRPIRSGRTGVDLATVGRVSTALPYQPQPQDPSPTPRRRLWPLVAVVVLVVALAAAGTVAVVQTSRLGDAQDEVARLQAQAQQDAARIEELRASLESRPGTGGTPLEDLLGGSGLEDLLEGSGLEDLLGGSGLEDLLGGSGLDGLEGLLGDGGAAPDVAGCVTGVTDLPDIDGTTLAQQFEQVAQTVEVLRGRDFPEPIEPELLSGQQIRDFFAEEIGAAYPAEVAEQDRQLLSALAAVPADIDLVQTQVGLLGDQVAGFYNDETRQLVVRAESPQDSLGALGLITLAHELDHALVDATIGLPQLDGFGEDEDGALAALAAVEGSAVATQTQFQTSALNPLALFGDLDALSGADQGLDDVPAFIAENLTFPYVAGPTYMCQAYATGGWDAVDAALQEPPTTSHQVLFGGTADAAPVAALTGPDGFQEQTRRTFGAAPLSWLFSAPGDDRDRALEDPVEAVRGWRGGQITLWTQDQDAAVGLALTGQDLCDPVTRWWTAAADGQVAGVDDPDEQVVAATRDGRWGVVTCDGDDVRVGLGPSAALARAAVA